MSARQKAAPYRGILHRIWQCFRRTQPPPLLSPLPIGSAPPVCPTFPCGSRKLQTPPSISVTPGMLHAPLAAAYSAYPKLSRSSPYQPVTLASQPLTVPRTLYSSYLSDSNNNYLRSRACVSERKTAEAQHPGDSPPFGSCGILQRYPTLSPAFVYQQVDPRQPTHLHTIHALSDPSPQTIQSASPGRADGKISETQDLDKSPSVRSCPRRCTSSLLLLLLRLFRKDFGSSLSLFVVCCVSMCICSFWFSQLGAPPIPAGRRPTPSNIARNTAPLSPKHQVTLLLHEPRPIFHFWPSLPQDLRILISRRGPGVVHRKNTHSHLERKTHVARERYR